MKHAIIYSIFIILVVSGTISGLQICAFIYRVLLKVELNFYSESTAHEFERDVQRCETAIYLLLCVPWSEISFNFQ